MKTGRGSEAPRRRAWRSPVRPWGLLAAAVLIALPAVPAAAEQGWSSDLVRRDAQGRLVYTSDADGNCIPDFSHAGYRGGGVAPPRIAAARTVRPGSGNDTVAIQAALDEVAALKPDARGFRGAVELAAGVYEIWGTLSIDASGVVLRGAGDGGDPARDTILLARGDAPHQRPVIVAGGGSPASAAWPDEVPGTRTNILTRVVPVGARSFAVADASAFRVGDNVIVVHPSTRRWIRAVDGGGTGADPSWAPGELDIVYNRRIRAIHGDGVVLDGPVFNHLDRRLSQSYVYLHDRSGIRTRIGLESLRIDIQTSGDPEDEDHAWDAIRLEEIEDAWVRDVTALHFGGSAVRTWQANRITVERVRALDPVSLLSGSRRYSFNAYRASNDILFVDCYATESRHAYVSNGVTSTSGIVFLDSTSLGDHNASEGHRRWSQGLLYDRCTFAEPNTTGAQLGLYNRGSYGTGHGWSAAHSVAWNTVVENSIVVQQPPTAQNYAIGCYGTVTPEGPWESPAGHIEGSNAPGLDPDSLYRAQLRDRRAHGIAPSQPARLEVVAADPPRLRWIDVAQDEDGYEIERSDDGGASWTRIGDTGPNVTNSVEAGGAWALFRVRAVNQRGGSIWSNAACYDPDGDGVCGGRQAAACASCGSSLEVRTAESGSQCHDGVDNDLDGLIDGQDDGCGVEDLPTRASLPAGAPAELEPLLPERFRLRR